MHVQGVFFAYLLANEQCIIGDLICNLIPLIIDVQAGATSSWVRTF